MLGQKFISQTFAVTCRFLSVHHFADCGYRLVDDAELTLSRGELSPNGFPFRFAAVAAVQQGLDLAGHLWHLLFAAAVEFGPLYNFGPFRPDS